jgi:hypothetical protein
MKGLGFLALVIPLIIVGALGFLYVTNFPITEVMGEKIGFADMLNFLFNQAPPNLPEKDMKSDAQLSALVTELTASEGGSLGALAAIGNPIKFCVFKDYNYCQILKIEGSKITESSETPQRTVYVSYELALELKSRVETQKYEGLEKRMVQAAKSGEIKGLTINDIMNFGK